MHENLVIRPAALSDLDQLMELSRLVGSGMTSMPTDEQSWIKKIERSISDFNSETAQKNSDIYFMVIEDLNNHQVVGSCAVYAGIGLTHPFYSYRLSTLSKSSEQLDMIVHTRVLNLVNDFTGATEIGSLFLIPEYRRDGIGKFLSRSRFLLLADFPERFDELVFAEMRGWLDENSSSPFWESLGKKFFNLSFQKADFISAVDGHQFISDLMPKYPVYLDLLSEEANAVIGKAHDDARGALRILNNEGFRYEGYVDIFDAGPSVQTRIEHVKTVKDSFAAPISEVVSVEKLESGINYLVSNSKLPDYRLSRAPIFVNNDGSVTISKTTADTLNVSAGDTIRCVLERPAPTQ